MIKMTKMPLEGDAMHDENYQNALRRRCYVHVKLPKYP